jgi:hypothetical protein
VIAALAEWHWGSRRMLAVFVGAAVLFNVQGVAFGVGGAGSSGATFALGASLAGALLLTATGPRPRLRAMLCPLFGAAMLAVGNIHGLALVYGTVIGLALRAWSWPSREAIHGAMRQSGRPTDPSARDSEDRRDEHGILGPLDRLHA